MWVFIVLLCLFIFNCSEIIEQYIYMVMECGNIDLNSWFKKKKFINLWERKSYWKNMLEVVYIIYQYGIFIFFYIRKVKIVVNCVILEIYF